MELRIENLSVDLSRNSILKEINLQVEDGSFISLLGPSGCGKTTLLKTIAGILEQKEGSIYLGGRLMDNIPPHKRKTIIVFQDFRVFPHMTVLDNIAFPMKMNGINKGEREKKALKLLDKVRLSGYENRYSDQLSGGQIQRIALARALAAQPDLLLLDEPFSNLDINLRKEMRQLVLDLKEEFKITTILVTHDQEEALAMSDKIAFMHKGEILQYDSPERIFNRPNNIIVADYFAEGTYIEGSVEKGYFKSKFLKEKVNLKDGSYKCLIRPENVEIISDDKGEYQIVNRVYLGESYLYTIKNDTFILESKNSSSNNFQIGDRVNISLDSERLIFIPMENSPYEK